MKESVIRSKVYDFALKIVNAYKILKQKRKYELASQLLRSGTSIGANTFEAQSAQTPRDFYAKFSISYKEANETFFWINLLRDSKILDEDIAKDLLLDLNQILKILATILANTRKRFNF